MKRKLTIALVAILSSHAFAAIPSELPKLMNQQELAGFRDKLAQQYSKKEEKAPSEPSAFYTGKPYLASTDTYAFKYRNYNPALARWTSEDPSGFPDGANNIIYVNNRVLTYVDNNGLRGKLVIHTRETGSSFLSDDGHAWIEYTPDGGSTTSYGTWGNKKPIGLHRNLELGGSRDSGRSKYLTDAEEQALMSHIAYYDSLGTDAWTPNSACSGFASSAWEAATGEEMPDGYPSTPTWLRNSIREKNGGNPFGTLE